MLDSWRRIQEDKVDHYKIMMSLLPLARTPMDKKSSRSLNTYQRKLDRHFNAMTPWRNKYSGLRQSLLARGVKPGEIAVFLSPGDTKDNPLYEGAKIIKE